MQHLSASGPGHLPGAGTTPRRSDREEWCDSRHLRLAHGVRVPSRRLHSRVLSGCRYVHRNRGPRHERGGHHVRGHRGPRDSGRRPGVQGDARVALSALQRGSGPQGGPYHANEAWLQGFAVRPARPLRRVIRQVEKLVITPGGDEAASSGRREGAGCGALVCGRSDEKQQATEQPCDTESEQGS